jgi:hypothetical protein
VGRDEVLMERILVCNHRKSAQVPAKFAEKGLIAEPANMVVELLLVVEPVIVVAVVLQGNG